MKTSARRRPTTQPEPVHLATLSTPVGRVLLGYRGSKVLRTGLGVSEPKFRRELAEAYGEPPLADAKPPPRLRADVLAHIKGKRPFASIDLSGLTPFQRQVLRATAKIPFGSVRTYGEIATAVGSRGAARAVGTALARNPMPVLIPCHRVVRANGVLGEYSGGGPTVKARLLAHEGARVK